MEEENLSSLLEGKTAVIKKLLGNIEFQRQLASLNIRVGKEIKKITSQPWGGPIVIKIDNTSVSLGQGMAAKIMVQEA